jgi:SAM-dependent methyltransferase
MQLTDPAYWEGRYRDVRGGKPRPEPEWLAPMIPHLLPYAGQRLLELGCVPGHASAAILSRVPLRPEGVDSADAGHLYLSELAPWSPRLHRCDLREFQPEGGPYDVVGSFGLVEHFDDVQEILDHHDRLLRPGGLCIVEVPHFRRVQFLYHRAFDRLDLARHNLRAMDPAVFEEFARRRGHDVLFLGFVGKMRFWGLDAGSGRLKRKLARLSERLGGALGHLLPEGNRWLAPWLVYVARKR